MGGDDFLVGVGIAFGNLRGDFHEAFVLQFANGLGSGAGELEQLLHRQRPVLLNHLIDFQLSFGQRLRAFSAGQQPHMQALAPTFLFLAHGIGQHTFQCGLRRAAIIFGNPSGQFQHLGGHQRLRPDDLGDRLEGLMVGLLRQSSHTPEHLPSTERHLHACAHLHPAFQIRRDEVVKLPAQGNLQCHTRDHASPSRPRASLERLMN